MTTGRGGLLVRKGAVDLNAAMLLAAEQGQNAVVSSGQSFEKFVFMCYVHLGFIMGFVFVWVVALFVMATLFPVLVLPMLFFTAVFVLTFSISEAPPNKVRLFRGLRTGFYCAALVNWSTWGVLKFCGYAPRDEYYGSFLIGSIALAAVGTYFQFKLPVKFPPLDDGPARVSGFKSTHSESRPTGADGGRGRPL